MKVLTIKEPYATLIKEQIKSIETRSWKTNYRGEIYIHASKPKIEKKVLDNKELMNLCKNLTFNQGNIICKGNLVDCIYMTEEFINDIKENNKFEFICGHYEVGRYAWIIKDIETIKPLPAKGKLGIWNCDENNILADENKV